MPLDYMIELNSIIEMQAPSLIRRQRRSQGYKLPTSTSVTYSLLIVQLLSQITYFSLSLISSQYALMDGILESSDYITLANSYL